MQYNTIISSCGTDCNCLKLSFTDSSIWDNTTNGHKLSLTDPLPAGYASAFGYRKIILTRPDGTQYIYSSLSTETKDELIDVLSPAGIVNFDYVFTNTDIDGLYTIQLYNFPLWDTTIAYKKAAKPIVFKDGVLYECVADTTSNDPALDTLETYWKPYTISASTDLTRYGVTSKHVVLCISVMGCYRDYIYNAFCGTVSNPCEDKIKNKDFNTAMKLQVIMEALDVASCENDWEAVIQMIDMLKKTCECNAAC